MAFQHFLWADVPIRRTFWYFCFFQHEQAKAWYNDFQSAAYARLEEIRSEKM